MTANTSQIFSKEGDIQWCSLTAANTATDGTGTVGTVFTSDATNGGRLERIRCMALGSNVATVARFFVNNGSTNATAGNNSLLFEVTLPATTASNSVAINTNEYEIPAQYSSQSPLDLTGCPLVLPKGYKVNVVLGTAVAAGWQFTGIGGKY